jgi:3-oxoacyl-[acyl-carrier protein] reductase
MTHAEGSERTVAWIFGGSGSVGSAVVRELTARGLSCRFSFHRNEAGARALHEATGAHAFALDASSVDAVRSWVEEALAASGLPRVVVYAAARSETVALGAIEPDEWDAALRVNVSAPFFVLQSLARRLAVEKGPLDAVLVGALDRGQSLPLPVHFAATQGALSAMTMALAREVGRLDMRVNQVALGVLEGGLSRMLDAPVVDQYLKFSALRRRGTPAEVARAIAWLALENTYMTGRVVPINGGI